jgi:hypothetical protein
MNNVYYSRAKIPSPQQELMKSMNFTAKDLAMNQMGKLSERQKQYIYWLEQYRWTRPLILCAILGLLLLGDAGYISASLMLYDKNTVPQGAILATVVLLMLIIWGSFETITSYRDVQHKLHSYVEGVQGIAIVDMRGFLQVGNETFFLPYEILLRIKHLEPHVVYYLPRWKQILSIEVFEH